ncbi:MAG: right-handed parallel beta-helix repeat-containing protein [Aeromicrobium sp.]
MTALTKFWTICGAMCLYFVLSTSAANAHVERPSYWPNPAADCSVTPCAGGKVPTARTLSSSLDKSLPGNTRVVCKSDSLTRVKAAIAKARKSGYDIRPTDHRTFSQSSGDSLLKTNEALFKLCGYHEIQAAVTASHNNDRVVIMPGLYTEPTSRAKPTFDAACDKYKVKSDSGDPGALSHAYQVNCPNDANLVAVIGRGVGPGEDPSPAPVDRHGIPNVGKCIRCNLQIEGSGVSADDVIIEAGDAAAGNGGPSAIGHKKDVGVYADQADGFVLRKVTVRHATEHDIYVMESDGYLLDQFKTFYGGAYGVLTFVEDHGLMQNCEAAGNGDSGLYPGAGAKTSAGRDTKYYPTFRYSQEIRLCDSHHNNSGYSGTNGNGTHLNHNNFYDNALGFTTDVFTAPGHPGFPQQGDLIEENNFYSNNFNPYVAGSDVKPFVAAPVGTGMWIAGGNDNVVRKNHFWDNHRRGAMLFSAPDAMVCGPVIGSTTPVPGCEPTKVSTSYRNSFTANVMGVAPDGSAKPNGKDFWWDSFPGNTGNCWWGNTGANGKPATTSPSSLPNCKNGTDPASSVGTGDLVNEAELVACFVGFEVSGYPNGNSTLCSWTKSPPTPGTASTSTTSTSTTSKADTTRTNAFLAYCAAGPVRSVCKPFMGQTKPSWLPFQHSGSVNVAPQTARRALGLYTCSDWKKATLGERSTLLARLHHFSGGAVVGDRLLGFGSILPDAQASTFFSHRCAPAYASEMALYKQYGEAAAFGGVAP